MGRIRILLVEDDEEFYEPMIDLINQNEEPIDVIFYCENGQEAVEIINIIGDNEIDFILADINMAKCGGMAFIGKIREKYNRLLSHIIIISTSIRYKNVGDIDLKQILIDNGVTLPSKEKPCDFLEVINDIKMFGISILNSNKEQKDIEEIQALILNKSVANSTCNNDSIECKVRQQLEEKYNIIVDENIKMTEYLCLAIVLAYKMKDKKMFVMKKIYTIIADEHNKKFPSDKTTHRNVEALVVKIIKEKIDETYSVKNFVYDFIKLL